MPITPTYPGVYLEEIPSGVRTIAGVSTSVTAFIGAAKRGPINKAVRIQNYSDYERRFGGFDIDSELSYSVRQFFLNGGSEAWIVRLAKNPDFAATTLTNVANATVLKIAALDEGKAGNNLEARVSYQTNNPASSFNLKISYISPSNPQENTSETFENLSLNSKDSRYVERVINGASALVKVERVADLTSIANLRGHSISVPLVDASNQLIDVATLIDATHNQLRVSVNGSDPISVTLSAPSGNNTAKLTKLSNAIATAVSPSAPGFTGQVAGNSIQLLSGQSGESSSVRVLPGLVNDVSARLKLGTINGGVETDAIANLRPAEKSNLQTLVSGGLTTLAALPDASSNKLQISLAGEAATEITLGTTVAVGSTLGARLSDIAARLEATVRAIKPAYQKFSVTVTTATDTTGNIASTQYKLVLTFDGAIAVTAAATNDIAAGLLLLNPNVTSNAPANLFLEGGTESLYSDSEAYSLLFGNPAQRKGIYALDAVDIFNLLVLPGLTDGAVLSEAAIYAQQRRAFLIADAPKTAITPAQIVQVITGSTLPKTDYGAIYYPWIYVPDPLNNGKLRLSPPSGTIAGLYARTDSSRGVWKAPAGTEATLAGVQQAGYLLTDGENGQLNPLGVNALRIFPVYGAVVWGARTLRGADQLTSEYKYVPVRRTALFIEESLYRGLQWVVFEPNDEPLWAQIRLNAGAFLNNLFRQGAFQGKTPREAYFIKCDKETTTQNDINLGIVNVLVGFAPLKPAEFVIIKLQQIAGQLST